MTGYEEFQRIMAELNRQIQESKKPDLPPGFEKIFGNLRNEYF